MCPCEVLKCTINICPSCEPSDRQATFTTERSNRRFDKETSLRKVSELRKETCSTRASGANLKEGAAGKVDAVIRLKGK